MSSLLNHLQQLRGIFGGRPIGFARANRAVTASASHYTALGKTDEHQIFIGAMHITNDIDLPILAMASFPLLFMGGMDQSPPMLVAGVACLGYSLADIHIDTRAERLIQRAYAQVGLQPHPGI